MEKVNQTYGLSKPWQKFLIKLEAYKTNELHEWKEYEVLGYLCHLYEDLYKMKFCLSFKGSPSKCTEIYLIKRMFAMLGTTNMNTIKAYIDWVFNTKIKAKNVKFRTLGFLTTPGFANEFYLFKAKTDKITKSSELPQECKDMSQALNLPISTYGDLAFIKKAVDANPESEARKPYKNLLNKMLSLGLDLSVLKDLV